MRNPTTRAMMEDAAAEAAVAATGAATAEAEVMTTETEESPHAMVVATRGDQVGKEVAAAAATHQRPSRLSRGQRLLCLAFRACA